MKLHKAEIRTDLEEIAVPGTTNGHAEEGNLAREILAERRDRLRKQNKKLYFEIQLKEEQYGDLNAIRRDVRRANAIVKQGLFGLVHRVSEQLAVLDDPTAIEAFLHAELRQCFNDLAYENRARGEPPDEE